MEFEIKSIKKTINLDKLYPLIVSLKNIENQTADKLYF